MTKAVTNEKLVVERKRRSNKKEFVRKAATALFVQKGYHGTTMDDIVAATGLNKGTIYFYFSAKHEILFEILDMVVSRIVGRLAIDPVDLGSIKAIELIIDGIINTIFELQPECAVYFKETQYIENILSSEQISIIVSKEKTFNLQFVKIYEHAVKEKILRSDISYTDFYHSVMGVCSFALRWITPRTAIADVISRTQNVILRGVFHNSAG